MRAVAILCVAIFINLPGLKAQNDQFQHPQWQKLDLKIKEHSIYGLGEIGHGYASINEAKGSMLQFLRQNLHVQAVVFESSFTLSVIAYLKRDSLNTRLKYSLYPFWNTGSVQRALLPFYQIEHSEKPRIVGCDIQEDCRFTRFSKFLINERLLITKAQKLVIADSILSYYIGTNFSRRTPMTNDEFKILKNLYEDIAGEFVKEDLPELTRRLLIRCIENRKWLCYYLTISNAEERMHFRDSLMANNVVWLKNEIYPDEKVALWAATLHIAKLKKVNQQPQWMGEWLALHFKNDYCAIDFQKGKFSNEDLLLPGFGVKYNPDGERFNAIIFLNKLNKIEKNEWRTPCD